MEIVMKPIGWVENSVMEKKDDFWGSSVSVIRLKDEFRGGLRGLEAFSHAVILCYLDRAGYVPEKHLCRHPRGRKDLPRLGIFSQRTKDHPNTIGVTVAEILRVEDCALVVKSLDAINGTSVLDIKPYFPAFDKRDAHTPDWVDVLMENYFLPGQE